MWGEICGEKQTPFKTRHSNHKQEVKKKVGGLGQHYGGNGCGYQNISIQIIDQVEVGDNRGLENQEIYGQNQLRCYIQNGVMPTAGERKKSLYVLFMVSFWSSTIVYLLVKVLCWLVVNAK